MKIKNLLIIILLFIEPDKSFATYKPIFGHFGYPTQTFITPTFASIPASNFKNDFTFAASTILSSNNGILLSADVYNKSFYPDKFKMMGIVPTKIFIENRLAICWVKKIEDGEYFYSGPGVRSVEVANDKYVKENFEFVNPANRGYVDLGFTIGYNRILKDFIAISTNVGLFASKYQPFMYSVDLNFVAVDNLAFNLGSSDTDVHGGFSLINNWGRIGYRANYIYNNIFHSITCGLALNY